MKSAALDLGEDRQCGARHRVPPWPMFRFKMSDVSAVAIVLCRL